MLRFRARCVGVSPYLMNPMTDQTLEDLRTKRRSEIKTDWTVQDQAATKLCQEDGQCGVPSLNLFSCLVNAGRHFTLSGRRKISTKEESLLPGMLSIEEEFLAFPNNGWVADKRRGQLNNAGKKTAVCLVRPKFKDWGFTVTLLIDETEIKPDMVRSLLNLAGKMKGLGDFRPSCRGPFGRFKVAEWEDLGKVEEEEAPSRLIYADLMSACLLLRGCLCA